jgi:hypothetical protein
MYGSRAARITGSVEPAMQRAYSTYNQGLVLRQIGEHINARAAPKNRQSGGRFPSMATAS